jgi:hypothetical protein
LYCLCSQQYLSRSSPCFNLLRTPSRSN